MKSNMRSRDDMREKARQTESETDWLEYRQRRNKCTKMLKRKKEQYISALYDSQLEKNNVRGIYRTTKQILGWESAGQPTSFLIGGKLLRKPVDIANEIQNFYERKINVRNKKMRT